MKTFEAINIQYDTDNKRITLPKRITVVVPDDVKGYDDTCEFISDKISEVTGFCHNGFDTIPEVPQVDSDELIELLQEVQAMFTHKSGESKSNKVKTDVFKHCPNIRDTMNKIRQTLWKADKNILAN